MEQDWVKVFEDDDQHMVEIMRMKLRDAGILPVTLNEHASSFPSLGETEIYVSQADAARAIEVIRSGDNE